MGTTGKSWSRIKWTPEMREDVRRRRLAGETTKAIAAEYGVTWQRIVQVAPVENFGDVQRVIAAKKRKDSKKERNVRARKRVRAAYDEMRDDFIAWARTI